MPALSSTMTEGKIVSWIKSEGDRLNKGESVVVVESDKADMDVETFYDGILAAIVVPEGDSAPVGAPIGLLAESEDEIAQAKSQANNNTQSQPRSDSDSDSSPATPQPAVSAKNVVQQGPRKVVATPYAKKLAKQHKVDIASVTGTGNFGRITPADVEAAAGILPPKKKTIHSIPVVVAETAPLSSKPASLPQIPGSTVVPFTTMQTAVSKNMVASLSVPTFRVGYPMITDALDAFYGKVYICVYIVLLIYLLIFSLLFIFHHLFVHLD